MLTVTINFVHIFRWDTTENTLFDDLGVFSDDVLNNLEIFHSDLDLMLGSIS